MDYVESCVIFSYTSKRQKANIVFLFQAAALVLLAVRISIRILKALVSQKNKDAMVDLNARITKTKSNAIR